jgi:hypothetical protein
MNPVGCVKFLHIILLSCCAVAGCRRFDEASYRQLVQSGFGVVPFANDFERLWPDAYHTIGSGEFADGSRQWNSEALFAGRYWLHAVAHVRVSADQKQILSMDAGPRFILHEIEAVNRESGSFSTTFRNQWEFDHGSWSKVVDADGDFSVIGIQLDLSHPVPDFEEYKRAYVRDYVVVRSKP